MTHGIFVLQTTQRVTRRRRILPIFTPPGFPPCQARWQLPTMEPIEKMLKTSFASAANQLTQLYPQQMFFLSYALNYVVVIHVK